MSKCAQNLHRPLPPRFIPQGWIVLLRTHPGAPGIAKALPFACYVDGERRRSTGQFSLCLHFWTVTVILNSNLAFQEGIFVKEERQSIFNGCWLDNLVFFRYTMIMWSFTCILTLGFANVRDKLNFPLPTG